MQDSVLRVDVCIPYHLLGIPEDGFLREVQLQLKCETAEHAIKLNQAIEDARRAADSYRRRCPYKFMVNFS